MPNIVSFFMSIHWAFSLLILLLVFAVVNRIVIYTGRFFTRTLTIWLRGWPPSHVDVDGDSVDSYEAEVKND